MTKREPKVPKNQHQMFHASHDAVMQGPRTLVEMQQGPNPLNAHELIELAKKRPERWGRMKPARCTCDEHCDDPCPQHGYGLLQCECGHKTEAPLVARSHLTVTCEVCQRWYVGVEDSAHGYWEHAGYRATVKQDG